jgi:AAA15 family ATPase/GTPase
MFVKSVSISNFKSFKQLDLNHLGRFNVLIGTNASGKTNFIQIFRFLRDLANHGLANAVSLQGGVDFLRNANLPQNKECSFRITYDPDLVSKRKKNGHVYTLKYLEIVYAFRFLFSDGDKVRIKQDHLFKKFEVFESPAPDEFVFKGTGESRLFNRGGEIVYELDLPSGILLSENDFIPPFLKDEKLEEDALLIGMPYFGFVHRLDKFFDKVSIYDFDPKLPKHSVPISGKTDLEEDASNLAICIKNIIENHEKKRKFINLVRDLLPFVEDIEIERLDKSLLLKMKDSFSGGNFVPSSFISHGTLNMIAMIIALYFDKKSLIIIEEPERSIHPGLLTKLVAMMKEVADRKQIIVTTHHPDIVKLADISDILFSSRDKEGFSTISRPAENEETRIFLEKELGIEDLFKQDLLGL